MKKILQKIILSALLFSVIFPMSALAQIVKADLVTKEATAITETTAKLNGSINPKGKETSGYFRFSAKVLFPPIFCNDIYGSDVISTNETNLGSGNSPMSLSIEVSDLDPNTTYYFCVVSSNKEAITYGGVKKFTTDISPYSNKSVSITTESPLVKNGTSVYLNAFYNTSVPATTWFEYKKVHYVTNMLSKTSALSSKMTPLNLTSSSSISTKNTTAIPTAGPTSNTSSKNMSSSPAINQISTATANSSSKTISGYDWSSKKGTTARKAKTNGNINFLLTGLSKNTTYQFRAVIKADDEALPIYGNTLTFKTNNSGDTSPDYDYYYDDDYDYDPNQNLSLGQKATPPELAIVRSSEGIEHVLIRQIMNNENLAKTYGYQDGADLYAFASNLAHLFARVFGYISTAKKEIRVSPPDIAAYQIELNSGNLTIYEYYAGVIVNIQKMTDILRNVYGYEYYFKKK
jgi:hypothetical protein